MKHRAFAMAMILLFLSIFGGTAAAKTEKLRLNTPVSLVAGEYCFSFTPPVGGYYSFFSYDSAVEIVFALVPKPFPWQVKPCFSIPAQHTKSFSPAKRTLCWK